jgi:hypothetical protein
MSYLEHLQDRNIYCCLLVKGTGATGERRHAYFGVFLAEIPEILRKVERGLPFNPKDHGTIVLARGDGEPDPETCEFMRRKFSFCDDSFTLELSLK